MSLRFWTLDFGLLLRLTAFLRQHHCIWHRIEGKYPEKDRRVVGDTYAARAFSCCCSFIYQHYLHFASLNTRSQVENDELKPLPTHPTVDSFRTVRKNLQRPTRRLLQTCWDPVIDSSCNAPLLRSLRCMSLAPNHFTSPSP